MIQPTHGLLHGGGFDSTLLFVSMLGLLKPYGFNVPAPHTFGVVHVDYGHLAAKAERAAILSQIGDASVIPQPHVPYPVFLTNTFVPEDVTATNFLFTGNAAHGVELPNRNRTMIETAIHNGICEIYVGAEPVPAYKTPMTDCTLPYLRALEAELRQADDRIRIHAPFLSLTYAEYRTFLRLAMRDRESLGDMMKTAMTCYTPTDGRDPHCGHCSHCQKRNAIMEDALWACQTD